MPLIIRATSAWFDVYVSPDSWFLSTGLAVSASPEWRCFYAGKFKTFIVCVEESNDGFHWDWDESKLKGKKVGAIFNEKEWEYNGNSGFFTNLHHFTAADKIRKNDFKIPEPTYLKNKKSASMPEGFVDVKPGTPEEVPF